MPNFDTTDDPMTEVKTSETSPQTGANENFRYEMTTAGNTEDLSTMNTVSN